MEEKDLQNNENEQQNKVETKQSWWQVLKFTLFSISAGVIQFGVFTLLSEVIDWAFWPSHLIALSLSVVWNFTFNRKFTFKSASNMPIAMTLAFLFYLPFTPVTVFGGQALVNVGWHSLLVEALTMILNFVLEFLWQKFVVFNENVTNKILQLIKKKED